jgi:3',5'-cyclic AMP phosphodiesterase CpdA
MAGAPAPEHRQPAHHAHRDANELSWEIQGLLGYSKGAQVRWLEETLAAWRRSPAVDFIVAFFHECAFSTCDGHSSDGGVRAKLAPLFSRFQVDLAIQGHNHVYERTNPLVYDPKTNSARSSQQAVALSPREPAEIEPARDGTSYVTVGTAGTPRYGWSNPKETDRNFAAGKGSGAVVTANPAKQTGPYVAEQDFSQRFETVDWSQARYADYGFIALDVIPARPGQRTTMTLRFIKQQGRELDRAVFTRPAAQSQPL